MTTLLITYAAMVVLLFILVGMAEDISSMDDQQIFFTVLLIVLFPFTGAYLFCIGLMVLGKKVKKWSGK